MDRIEDGPHDDTVVIVWHWAGQQGCAAVLAWIAILIGSLVFPPEITQRLIDRNEPVPNLRAGGRIAG